MSGWTELRDLGIVCRPFDGPAPVTVGTQSRFRMGWEETTWNLARELRMLDAEKIVLELAVGERDLRIDGMPRADARLQSPAVRLSFQSKWGPLRYETGEFHHWQDNVSALARSMEALRLVDRYGVSKRGEQYQGWRAIPMSTGGEASIDTYGQAVAHIHSLVGDIYDESDIEGAFQAEAIRQSLRLTHPDRGGTDEAFRKAVKARDILVANAR